MFDKDKLYRLLKKSVHLCRSAEWRKDKGKEDWCEWCEHTKSQGHDEYCVMWVFLKETKRMI